MTIKHALAFVRKRGLGAYTKQLLSTCANIITRQFFTLGTRHSHRFEVECYGPDGVLKWRDVSTNLVVNEGLDDILDKYYKGSAYTAAFYVGLIDDTPTIAATDTHATHAGWVEATPYSEAVRQTLTLGTVASQSVDNSASKASYSINATDTVGGAFVSDDNTKGGTSGSSIIVGAAAFSGGDKAVANGDTLNVTVTATASSS